MLLLRGVGSPLTRDLYVTGPLSATLFVSAANVNDTDFTAKLTDVYPGERSGVVGACVSGVEGGCMGAIASPVGALAVTDRWMCSHFRC